MFLRAGMVSLVFLLASRLLGLLRETAQAAAFGATATGDLAVLMLSLPDWVAGVLASGALAYVLLPAWARHSPAQVAAAQRRVAVRLLAAGGALAAAAILLQGAVLAALLPGLPANAQADGRQALLWSALAIPLALLAALWATRLQHEKDFAGLYGGNVAVNLIVVAALFLLAARPDRGAGVAVFVLGLALLLAMAARAAWQLARLRRFKVALAAGPDAGLPPVPIWAWAIASAGLPLALPFVARSLASHEGAGALATFNYAWKLVELPLLLAVQLVATLALGPIAQAWASAPPAADAGAVARRALALAWTLACASAAGIAVAAPALAQLLFGWGRMDESALVQVAAWARIASWGLLPQALTAVGLAVLAAQSRMRSAALAHAVALVLLLAGPRDGASLMLWLNLLAAGISIAVLASIGCAVLGWLPWRALAAAGAVLLLAQLGSAPVSAAGNLAQLAAGAAAALVVVLAAWAASPDVRMALKR